MRYRYHWLFKLLALVLAVISGAVLVLGAAGLVLSESSYYEDIRRSQHYDDLRNFCDRASEAVFDRFAWEGTDIDPKLFSRFFRWGADVTAIDQLEQDFYYTVRGDKTGEVFDSNLPAGAECDWSWENTYIVRPDGSKTKVTHKGNH